MQGKVQNKLQQVSLRELLNLATYYDMTLLKIESG